MKKEDLDFVNSAAKIKNRVSVPSYYFESLPKDLRATAFTVSNLETLSQIEIVKRSLENAQREGLSFYDWKNQLDTDSIRNLSRSRLETVYRTNLSSVYNTSKRYNAATTSATPYMLFSAVGDSRTRPQHEKLDGIIKRADSPFWDRYTPPLGYNCRCTLIPISTAEAKRRGISRASEEKLPPPDRGFDNPKPLGDVSSGVNERANQAVSRLPSGSPYRAKFLQAQANISSLVDVWWNINQNKF